MENVFDTAEQKVTLDVLGRLIFAYVLVEREIVEVNASYEVKQSALVESGIPFQMKVCDLSVLKEIRMYFVTCAFHRNNSLS